MSDTIAVGYAKLIEERAGVRAKPLLKAGVDNAPTNAAGQIEGEGTLALLQPVADRVRRLYESPSALVILMTRRDLNSAAGGTRYLFSFHNFATNLSVVSGARCAAGAASDEVALHRLYKLLLRAVGEQVLHLPRSSDPASIMYAPLLGVDDLDMIGETLGSHI